ncbi:MAG: phosphoenolpyruvate--protein phosphotransferase [Gammaproteobacteria bacterium]
MSNKKSGHGVSPGIAIGHAWRIEHDLTEIFEVSIAQDQIEDEVSRFRRAVRMARQQLRDIRNNIPDSTRADVTDFIDTHLLMLEDSMLTSAPVELIRDSQCNAEWALKSQRDALAAVFDQMDDPYLRTRKDDVDHVVKRIMQNLLKQETLGANDVNPQLKGAIILAYDLTPAETILLQHQGIAGFVTETGGPLSHTAILARNLEIPAVVGLAISRSIHEGDMLILDGDNGLLIQADNQETLDTYHRKQRDIEHRRTILDGLKNTPSITLDGIPVHLYANIERREDVRIARRYNADGIGLYRTEFLFMNRQDIPDEQEQYQEYSAVIKSLQGLPLTIRTLDIGADKCADFLVSSPRKQINPALGLRAVRLCLKYTDLFSIQLRAILRASAKGPVRLMVPMLSNESEILQMLQLIENIKAELRANHIEFDESLAIGGMIEIPAAALTATSFARHLDFLSIGTNDLIQYTLAIDRLDDEVTYLYDPAHPAVLRLIQMTISAGKSNDIPVSMCGEMAGDLKYTRLLLGMGLTDFSVSPSALLKIKEVINQTSIEKLDPVIRNILSSDSSSEIQQHLDTLNKA